MAMVVAERREGPADVETAERSIVGSDADTARANEFGARAEAVHQPTECQALLGFVGILVAVDDGCIADQGNELGIALDVGDDIEQPFRWQRYGAALTMGCHESLPSPTLGAALSPSGG